MKRDIIYILAIVVLLFFLFQKKANKFIPITFTIPAVFHQFDTIKNPAEVIKLPSEVIIDSIYYDKYIALLEEKEKDSAYKDAVTIREYNQVFEDSIAKITVFSKSRGWLVEQTASYDIKERKFTENAPIPQKYHLFMGGGAGVPMKDNSSIQPLYQGGFMIQNKKGNLLNIETDHKLERVYVKYYFNVF